jgi:hypothetical protein
MKVSSRSDSRSTGGRFRAASFTRYAVFSFSGFVQMEKDREIWNPGLHINVLRRGPRQRTLISE